MATMQKPFFKSRTNWSGIIVVVLGLLQLLAILLSVQTGGRKMLVIAIATIVFGAAMIIFRTWFADKPAGN
jgi:hypothetical protein